MKSDGSYTYFAADIAYHYNKLRARLRHLDQRLRRRSHRLHPAHAGGRGGLHRRHVERDAKGKLKLDTTAARPTSTSRSCQLVKLFKTGEPVKMSKRAGTFVTLRDVVDEVGRDPVRFMMLYRKEREPLDFDFAKVTGAVEGQSGLLRAVRARARRVGVPQCAGGVSRAVTGQPGGARRRPVQLTDPGEIDLIKKLASFPASDRRTPRAPTSRIGSLSISMIWLRLFTANGPEAMICHICALFRQMTGL